MPSLSQNSVRTRPTKTEAVGAVGVGRAAHQIPAIILSCRRHAVHFQIPHGHNRPRPIIYRTGLYMAVANENLERPEARRAIRAGLQTGSDLQIAGRRALSQRREWWCNAGLVLAVGAIPVAVWLIGIFQVGYAAGLLCCAAVLSGIAALVRSRARAHAHANSTLSGEELTEAIHLVKKSAEAAQYRDAIVRSGRKLYRFDLDAMRRLDTHEATRAADVHEAAQRTWLHTQGATSQRPDSKQAPTVVRDTAR